MIVDVTLNEMDSSFEPTFGEVHIVSNGGGGEGGGENGATFIPSVSDEGVISWTNDKGLPNPKPVNIMGKPGVDGIDGKDGKDGVNGKDGKTPQKGVDYYTEADKSEMVQAVLSALPDYREVAH